MGAPEAYPNLVRAGRGRPRGSKNHLPKKIWGIVRRLLEDKDYIEGLIARIKAGKARHIELLMFEHILGKPPSDVRLKVSQIQERVHVYLPEKDNLDVGPVAPQALPEGEPEAEEAEIEEAEEEE